MKRWTVGIGYAERCSAGEKKVTGFGRPRSNHRETELVLSISSANVHAQYVNQLKTGQNVRFDG
jgi:hypothetical protein